MARTEVERLFANVTDAAESDDVTPLALALLLEELLAAVRAEEREAIENHQPDECVDSKCPVCIVVARYAFQLRESIAASCEAQAAVCATPARAGAYRHCARMARDVTARVAGRGGGA